MYHSTVCNAKGVFYGEKPRENSHFILQLPLEHFTVFQAILLVLLPATLKILLSLTALISVFEPKFWLTISLQYANIASLTYFATPKINAALIILVLSYSRKQIGEHIQLLVWR